MAEEKTTAANVATKKEDTVSESTTVKKAKAAPKKAVKKAETSPSNKTTAKKAVKKTTDGADQKTAAPKVDAGAKREPAADDKAGANKASAESKASEPAATVSAPTAKPAEAKAVEEKPAKKTAAKKPAAKKATTKKAATVKVEKVEAKAEEEKPAKKTAAKKPAAKKATTKKTATAKVEKVEEKPAAKKAEPVKEEKVEAKKVEKPVAKTEEKPVEKPAAKAEAKPAEKPVEKAEPKVEAKPVEVVEETITVTPEEKAAVYNDFSLDTLIDMAKQLGIDKGYDDYKNILMDETDLDQIVADLKKEAKEADTFNYVDDGYDIDILPILIKKVGDTMEIKASDFNELSTRIANAMKLELNDDALHNTDVYNELFDTVRQVLILAQRRNIRSLDEIDRYLKADIRGLVTKFMDVAYSVLTNWQYKDVKYYEGFIYSVLSQFDVLQQELGNRAMMDVADLLILHGDYGLGDANYRYIIRENDLKDMIYFRFANIYKNIDRDKARAIANEALQWVDGRYEYYPAIIEILQN